MAIKNPEELLNRAKINMFRKKDTVFFSTLCFSLKHKFSDKVPYAGTNGLVVYYNPEFFASLTLDEQIFLMLHETLHCAYMHMLRAKQKNMNHRLANIAADHVINLQLIERGFTMPKNGLADPRFSNMSMDQIYDILIKEHDQKKQSGQGGNDESFVEDFMEPEDGDGDAANDEVVQKKIQDALLRAVTQSKLSSDKPGSIPGDIEIMLDKLLNPKLPWTTILMRYFKNYSKTDYSWKRLNRRYMPKHLLPTLYSESLMELVVAIDTSGSVTDEQFNQFISEVHFTMKTLKPPKITLIQFDHMIKAVDEIRSLKDLMRVKFSGRGGTYIDPVIQKINEIKPQVALVFTDGYFSPPSEKTNSDMIWLIHGNETWQAPYGKAIHYELS